MLHNLIFFSLSLQKDKQPTLRLSVKNTPLPYPPEMAGAPHVLLIPFPAQGHVVPFMALAHSLVDHGFIVSFLNTHFNHDRLCSASSEVEDADDGRRRLRMVSIPDGLAAGEDRADLAKLVDGFTRVMPPCLEELIRKTNDGHEEVEEEERIRWIIADENMGWAFEVAKKMGVRAAAYWCASASAACLSLHISIPKLIQDYVLHENGLPRRNDDDDDEYFDLSSGFPPIKTTQFAWNCAGGGAKGQKIIFDLVISNNRALELADFIIVNSSHDLEPSAFTLFPNLLPSARSSRPAAAAGGLMSPRTRSRSSDISGARTLRAYSGSACRARAQSFTLLLEASHCSDINSSKSSPSPSSSPAGHSYGSSDQTRL